MTKQEAITELLGSCADFDRECMRKDIEPLADAILDACVAVVKTHCTCGSGGHPRECKTHPDYYALHAAEIEQVQKDLNAWPVGSLAWVLEQKPQRIRRRAFDPLMILDVTGAGLWWVDNGARFRLNEEHATSTDWEVCE